MVTSLIVLAGNPNTGKSSLFNALTKGNQHVGNWPGKTVAKMEGYLDIENHRVSIVDLPGTYSLSAYSPEEVITRDYLLDEKPDLIVNVIDADNLERNLYLTVQLQELGTPLLLVLNKGDMAAKRGIDIDTGRLAETLQAPVVETNAAKGIGLKQLKQQILSILEGES